MQDRASQVDFANIEDSLENAAIEYIASTNEGVEKERESFQSSGPEVQSGVKKIVKCIKTPEIFNLLLSSRASSSASFGSF